MWDLSGLNVRHYDCTTFFEPLFTQAVFAFLALYLLLLHCSTTSDNSFIQVIGYS